MRLAGSRILVIGGARRLGGVVARDLAARGAAVCATTRQLDAAAEEQRSALGDAGVLLAGTTSSAASAGRLVHEAAEALGGLDALVYAASGPFTPTPPELLDEAAWDASFDVVAKGFFFAACAARSRFAERPPAEPCDSAGVVVAITDLLGVQPWANFAAHGAARAAQIHTVKELARAWAPERVRVCGVAPGAVDLADDERREASLRTAARCAAQRLVPAAEVAAAVRFCLKTSSLTGINLTVENGALLTS